MTTILETERLALRNWTDDDIAPAHAMYRDPRVVRYLDYRVDATLDATRARIDRRRRHQAEYGYTMWAVVEKATGELLGACGLIHLDGCSEIEVGYHLAPHAWNRGIATEAARACVRYGFREARLDRIVAVTDPGNHASRRVLEKAGLTYLGMRYCYRSVTTNFLITADDAKSRGLD